ncbi:RNA methyltransferase [Candidatus Nomurabacteria bacterium]|uniref:RNA methyltransferase n=1 Tax=candidate division WWE3 bacterium TaxID=2053526 RepID=A0A955IXD6_UNCKA|nr:RNA methyltransferase [candidate division WWE3 bacterium]MCB9823591.1 RNA methyltransferase [Candidatus Nomurabacteria bacterium]MCB9827386.1 RNA methyltransferase [Candidatus Nomurabacteria bacterium]HXK52733.1 RNA methyltransferase [bacterium]
MFISSLQNKTIKEVSKLKNKKYRDKALLVPVEELQSIAFAMQNGFTIAKVFYCRSILNIKFGDLQALDMFVKIPCELTEVSQEVFMKITSAAKNPSGIIALVKQRDASLVKHTPNFGDLYLAAEGIEQPYNLGALIRLADNVGAKGVFLCDVRADLYDPETVRSSLGTIFCLKIFRTTSVEVANWCRINDLKTCITSPGAKLSCFDTDLTKCSVVVVGAEHGGLSKFWLDKADIKIKIPMYGQAESLSVSSSAAISLYELVRQKG